MHGQSTDSRLIKPRRRRLPDQPAQPGHQQRPLVVARLPDVTAGTASSTAGPIHYRFDHVDTAACPEPAGSRKTNEPETHVEATPLTRDWYRLASGLAISLFLLYLAVHSLFQMKSVQKNVDAGVITNDNRIHVAETPDAPPAAIEPRIVIPTSPQFLSNPVAADENGSVQPLLTETDVIDFPSGRLPVDGSSDPIESTHSIGKIPRSIPPVENASPDDPCSMLDSISIDTTSDYPGTGYPSIQDPLVQQGPPNVGESNSTTPAATARLQGTIEKYTESSR